MAGFRKDPHSPQGGRFMSGYSAIEMIQKMVTGQVALNAPMSNITASRSGGTTDILITPSDVEDLARVVKFLSQRGIKYFVMGGATGILVRDGGIRGAVIRLGPSFQGMKVLDADGNSPVIRASAGSNVSELVRSMAEQGLGGVEFLYGI
ncbi:FAD-binding protein, partial [bacterium]